MILFCTMVQGVKQIDFKDFGINVPASGQNRRVGNILSQFWKKNTLAQHSRYNHIHKFDAYI